MKSWRRMQAELFVGSLWRLAGARITLVELAETWQLDDAEGFHTRVDQLTAELETHIRERWRALRP
jgi:hypothetical protein